MRLLWRDERLQLMDHLPNVDQLCRAIFSFDARALEFGHRPTLARLNALLDDDQVMRLEPGVPGHVDVLVPKYEGGMRRGCILSAPWALQWARLGARLWRYYLAYFKAHCEGVQFAYKPAAKRSLAGIRSKGLFTPLGHQRFTSALTARLQGSPIATVTDIDRFFERIREDHVIDIPRWACPDRALVLEIAGFVGWYGGLPVGYSTSYMVACLILASLHRAVKVDGLDMFFYSDDGRAATKDRMGGGQLRARLESVLEDIGLNLQHKKCRTYDEVNSSFIPRIGPPGSLDLKDYVVEDALDYDLELSPHASHHPGDLGGRVRLGDLDLRRLYRERYSPGKDAPADHPGRAAIQAVGIKGSRELDDDLLELLNSRPAHTLYAVKASSPGALAAAASEVLACSEHSRYAEHNVVEILRGLKATPLQERAPDRRAVSAGFLRLITSDLSPALELGALEYATVHGNPLHSEALTTRDHFGAPASILLERCNAVLRADRAERNRYYAVVCTMRPELTPMVAELRHSA